MDDLDGLLGAKKAFLGGISGVSYRSIECSHCWGDCSQ